MEAIVGASPTVNRALRDLLAPIDAGLFYAQQPCIADLSIGNDTSSGVIGADLDIADRAILGVPLFSEEDLRGRQGKFHDLLAFYSGQENLLRNPDFTSAAIAESLDEGSNQIVADSGCAQVFFTGRCVLRPGDDALVSGTLNPNFLLYSQFWHRPTVRIAGRDDEIPGWTEVVLDKIEFTTEEAQNENIITDQNDIWSQEGAN